jgi:phosphoribosylformylglycinamidine (FGAM) synthase PurS component
MKDCFSVPTGTATAKLTLMKNWKVEVYYKPEVPDTVGQGILEDITDLGINGIDSVRTATVYWIEGSLDAETIDCIGTELLADPITQAYTFGTENDTETDWTLEVQFKPGVTDAVGDSTVKGIKDLGIAGVTTVRTGHKYWFTGALNAEVLKTIAQRLLMNEVIQTFSYQAPRS